MKLGQTVHVHLKTTGSVKWAYLKFKSGSLHSWILHERTNDVGCRLLTRWGGWGGWVDPADPWPNQVSGNPSRNTRRIRESTNVSCGQPHMHAVNPNAVNPRRNTRRIRVSTNVSCGSSSHSHPYPSIYLSHWTCQTPCPVREVERTAVFLGPTRKPDNPIRFFTNGSGLDLKIRPEIFIGSGSDITISNLKPDNKPEKRVNVINGIYHHAFHYI